MDTKAYIVQYNSGDGVQESFYEWVGDRVYVDREDCIQAILNEGYNYDRYDKFLETDVYIRSIGANRPHVAASILELDIVLEVEKIRG